MADKSMGEALETKRSKLEKQSPLLTYELLRKRLAYLRDQLKERYDTASREVKKENAAAPTSEEPLEKYVAQLKAKNAETEGRMAELLERTAVLSSAIDRERVERIKTAKTYKDIVEGIKNEYKGLQQALEEKELTLLRLKGEKSETEECTINYKIKEKEVAQLQQQRDAMFHKMEQTRFLLQSQHLKAILSI